MFIYRTLCPLTLSIWQVGDCGLQTYQTEIKLERAKTVEFTTVTPICYIHPKFEFSYISRLTKKERKSGVRLLYILSIKLVNIDDPHSFAT